MKLLFSNKTRDDILIKDKLDAIANDETCTNIQISHTITREEGDLGPGLLTGRVTLAMLQEIGFPEPGNNTFIWSCGPSDMTKAIKTLLTEAGYAEDRIFP